MTIDKYLFLNAHLKKDYLLKIIELKEYLLEFIILKVCMLANGQLIKWTTKLRRNIKTKNF
jgi:hypothetical protein